MKLLHLISNERRTIIEKNAKLIAKIAFQNLHDVGVKIIACDMLANLNNEKNAGEQVVYVRLAPNALVWEVLKTAVVKEFRLNKPSTVNLMKAVINVIFKVCLYFLM